MTKLEELEDALDAAEIASDEAWRAYIMTYGNQKAFNDAELAYYAAWRAYKAELKKQENN